MTGPVVENDPALRPYLTAGSEPEARRHLEALMAELDPTITVIIRKKLRLGQNTENSGATADDVRGEAVVQILSRLDGLRRGTETPIGSLRGFVAVTTYRLCDTHLRRRYPRRASLKNKLLYLLSGRTSQRGLVHWEGPAGEHLCGFDVWRDDQRGAQRSPALQHLLDRPREAVAAALPGEDPQHANPGDLVAAILDRAGGPIELDDLLAILAEVWDVRDSPPARDSGDVAVADPYAGIADPGAPTATLVEQRSTLSALWAEIRQLPPRQCAALLLNLRDSAGTGVIALFPILRIAGIGELAAAVALTPERFAAVWNELPMDDLTIASLLDCTRQQVINLRKVARERLSRRLRAAGVTI